MRKPYISPGLSRGDRSARIDRWSRTCTDVAGFFCFLREPQPPIPPRLEGSHRGYDSLQSRPFRTDCDVQRTSYTLFGVKQMVGQNNFAKLNFLDVSRIGETALGVSVEQGRIAAGRAFKVNPQGLVQVSDTRNGRSCTQSSDFSPTG
jgi:hypothetical protein